MTSVCLLLLLILSLHRGLKVEAYWPSCSTWRTVHSQEKHLSSKDHPRMCCLPTAEFLSDDILCRVACTCRRHQSCIRHLGTLFGRWNLHSACTTCRSLTTLWFSRLLGSSLRLKGMVLSWMFLTVMRQSQSSPRSLLSQRIPLCPRRTTLRQLQLRRSHWTCSRDLTAWWLRWLNSWFHCVLRRWCHHHIFCQLRI